MRILLAIDDSKFSEAAVETVIEQARPHRTEVRILHVVESPPLLVARELGGYEPALQNALEFQKQRRPRQSSRQGRGDCSVPESLKVTAALETGDPKSKILDVAEEWHADLIVLGSHGRKGLNRFLMGSVSDAIARHACCSVEIVRICPANAKN